MSIVLGIFEEGLIYAIVALGVYITYKILDFPDLSVDGTFPLGAAITAVLILKDVNPVLILILSFIGGALAGCATGLIHVKLKVRDLLSGIIVMTALYSVNLRIAGKANLPIFSKPTIFEATGSSDFGGVLLLFIITIVCKLLLDWYLSTRSGYLLRAVGDNEVLVTSLAKDKGLVKIVGLSIANGFVSLAGSIYCQQRGFFEISIGTGTIVIALASVIIGTKMFRKVSFMKTTTAVIIGSIIYKACVSLAIAMGMQASDLKLITAILFLIILVTSSQSGKKGKAHANTKSHS